jgi:hypothetical protein
MIMPALTETLQSHTVIFHYTVFSRKCGISTKRTHNEFDNHLNLALFVKFHSNTTTNIGVTVPNSYAPLYSIIQQSHYFYSENSLWSYLSTESSFMYQILRLYSHKFGLNLRYTVIVQHLTALYSKLCIFMSRTHRD